MSHYDCSCDLTNSRNAGETGRFLPKGTRQMDWFWIKYDVDGEKLHGYQLPRDVMSWVRPVIAELYDQKLAEKPYQTRFTLKKARVRSGYLLGRRLPFLEEIRNH